MLYNYDNCDKRTIKPIIKQNENDFTNVRNSRTIYFTIVQCFFYGQKSRKTLRKKQEVKKGSKSILIPDKALVLPLHLTSNFVTSFFSLISRRLFFPTSVFFSGPLERCRAFRFTDTPLPSFFFVSLFSSLSLQTAPRCLIKRIPPSTLSQVLVPTSKCFCSKQSSQRFLILSRDHFLTSPFFFVQSRCQQV